MVTDMAKLIEIKGKPGFVNIEHIPGVLRLGEDGKPLVLPFDEAILRNGRGEFSYWSEQGPVEFESPAETESEEIDGGLSPGE
jgi:hypothetical protein